MIADIIVAAIMLFSAVLGYKKGFVKTISKVVCLIISIVAAKLLYPYVAEFVGNSPLGELIREKVTASYTGYMSEKAPIFLQKIGDYTANGLAETAISIVAIIAIIIITYLISKLAAMLLGLVAKLPVISFFNRIAGMAAGLVSGALISYALVALVIFADIKGTEQWMESSVVAIKMYMNNFLLNLIF